MKPASDLRNLLRAIAGAAYQKAQASQLPPLIFEVLSLQNTHAERLAAVAEASAAAMTSAREVNAAKARCAAALKAGDPVTISYKGRVFTVERVTDHRQLCIRESRAIRARPAEVRSNPAPMQVAA